MGVLWKAGNGMYQTTDSGCLSVLELEIFESELLKAFHPNASRKSRWFWFYCGFGSTMDHGRVLGNL